MSRPGARPPAHPHDSGVSCESPPTAPDYTTATTMLLLERASGGDDVALERLCRRYLPRLLHWASGRLPGFARELMDTHDLVQEAVVASVARIEDFRPQHRNSFQAYLRTAVMNRLRNEVQRVQRRPDTVEVDSRLSDPSPSPVEELIGSEALDRFERGLELLRPEDRELVISRVEFDFSYTEIAIFHGKPSADAARMAVARALLRLATIMKQLERTSP